MKIAYQISKFNRGRKYNYFLQKINPLAKDKILDIGFTDNDYSEEANYLEKHYPYRENITALGIDNSGNFNLMFPEVTTVIYDGNRFPFADHSFEIGWSNAVVEHVGNREKQVLFVKEMLRTCRIVFFTTPDRFFPFDLHTQFPAVHWLPKKYSDRIFRFFGKGWAAGDYMNLLSKKQLISVCKEAGAKSIILKRNRLLGFSMDFSVIVYQ
jgi:SAM-dependent methyltransferase